MDNTLRKAAEMAFEALNEVTGWQWAGPMRVMDEVEDAIEALRQALAQPEQSIIPKFPEPFSQADLEIDPPESWDDGHKKTWVDLQVCQRNKIQLHKYAKHLRELLAQPEQEPVAWITRRTGDGGVVLSGYEICEPTDYDAIPVYTAPPKREWVGLTDEEIPTIDLEYSCGHVTYDEKAFARAIEAALRSKNT